MTSSRFDELCCFETSNSSSGGVSFASGRTNSTIDFISCSFSPFLFRLSRIERIESQLCDFVEKRTCREPLRSDTRKNGTCCNIFWWTNKGNLTQPTVFKWALRDMQSFRNLKKTTDRPRCLLWNVVLSKQDWRSICLELTKFLLRQRRCIAKTVDVTDPLAGCYCYFRS